MIKIIKEQKLNEMALPRKKVIEKVSGLSDVIGEHLIKCLVYEHSLDHFSNEDNYEHWKSEISFWLWYAGDIEVKNQYRLRKFDYEQFIFNEFAESLHDCKTQLLSFLLKVKRNNKYPEFQVTEDLCNKLFALLKYLKFTTCSLMSDKSKQHTEEEYKQIINEIL